MVRVRSTIIAGCMLAAPVFAHAQVSVIGNGLGKKCFDAVSANTSRMGNPTSICSDALSSGTLNIRDRMATLVNRGIARMRNNDNEGALKDYAAAKRLRPETGSIYTNEGAALIRIGRYEEAVDALLTSLELGTPEPHVSHYNLGLAFEQLGQINEAYQSFNTALEQRPDWELPQLQLSRFRIVEQ